MIVLFDFDEVFVDINTNALKYINSKLGTEYTLDDVKTWDFYDTSTIRPLFVEYLEHPEIYQKDAIPNKQMINILKQIVEMGEHEAYIVTASIEASHPSKHRFIEDNLSFFDEKRIFVVNDSSPFKNKSDVLEHLKLNYQEPTVLVDDGIHNILDMMADIKHKEKLDSTMKQFYSTRELKKYNNPYHDFVYGIIPELPYNSGITTGKRIFKLKKPKEIWKLLKNIDESHNYRIVEKQGEILNYIGACMQDNLADQPLNEVKQATNNAKYLVKRCFGKATKQVDFLDNVTELVTQASYIIKQKDPNKACEELNEKIFNKTDDIFGSHIMYRDIKNLIVYNSLNINNNNDLNEETKNFAKNGKKSGEYYHLNSPKNQPVLQQISAKAKDIAENTEILINNIKGGNINFEKLNSIVEEHRMELPQTLVSFVQNNNNNNIGNGLMLKTELNTFFTKNNHLKNGQLVPINNYIEHIKNDLFSLNEPELIQNKKCKM